MSLREIVITDPEQCFIIESVETKQDHGQCLACGQDVQWIIDPWFENHMHAYREGMRCSSCNLISRQRAVMFYLQLLARPGDRIYFQEQSSAAFALAQARLAGCEVMGSEYTPVLGCRCENVEQLSFADCEFDFVVSQDVFEHVEHPWQGFRECFRVLKPGAHMLMTVPFPGQPVAVSIDRRRAGLPDYFHGDPHRESGALVYTDFGWDLVSRLEEIGFLVKILALQSAHHGHPGPVLLWHLRRP